METLIEYTELINTFLKWSALIIILSMGGTNKSYEGLKANNSRRMFVIVIFNILIITSIVLGNTVSAIIFCLVAPMAIKNYVRIKSILKLIERGREMTKKLDEMKKNNKVGNTS